MKKILTILTFFSILISFYILNHQDNIFLKDLSKKNIKIISIYDVQSYDKEISLFFNTLDDFSISNKIEIIKIDPYENNSILKKIYTPINNDNLKINPNFNPNISLELLPYSDFKSENFRGTYYVSSDNQILEKELDKLDIEYDVFDYKLLNQFLFNSNISMFLPIILAIFFMLIVYVSLNSIKNSRTFYLKKIDGISTTSIAHYHLKKDLIFYIKINILLGLSGIIFLKYYNNFSQLFLFLIIWLSLSLFFYIIFSLVFVVTIFIHRLGPYEDSLQTKEKSKKFLFYIDILKVLSTIILIFIIQLSLNNFNRISSIVNFYNWSNIEDYVSIDISSRIPQDDTHYNEIILNTHKLISHENKLLLSVYNRGFDYDNTNFFPNDGNSMTVSKEYLDFLTIFDSNKNKIDSDNTIFKDYKYNILAPEMYKAENDLLLESYGEWINFITEKSISLKDIHIEYIKNNQETLSFAFDSNIEDLKLKNATILILNPHELSPDFIFSYLSNRYLQIEPSQEFFSNIKENNLELYFFSVTNTIKHISSIVAQEKNNLLRILLILLILLFCILFFEILSIQILFLFRKREFFLLSIDGNNFISKYKDIFLKFIFIDVSILIVFYFLGLTTDVTLLTTFVFLIFTYIFYMLYLKKYDYHLYIL